MLTQSVVPGGQDKKVLVGQVWTSTNGYGTVTVFQVSKNHVFFYPKSGGVAKYRKTMEDFLRDFAPAD